MGVNFYVQKHPEKTPREWYPLIPQNVVAIARSILSQIYGNNNFEAALSLVKKEEDTSATGKSGKEGQSFKDKGRGSNMWAVSPKKSTISKAMLVINPHLPWDGPGQLWEVHIKSDEGWNVMGATFFGMPCVGIGHNDFLGWSHTANFPSTWNVYRVKLNPQNKDQYYYEGKWRDIEVIVEKFKVKRKDKIEEISRELEYTHYGPIIRRAGDHAYALKISGWDDVLAMYQWYRMSKAKNFKKFKEAIQILAVPFNVGYADIEGNIFYAYSGKVARKSEKIDWHKIVEGGTKKTEWENDYFSFDKLPQVINPKSGFIQNCNNTPFETTAGNDNPKKEDFPNYLTVEEMTPRSQRLRQLLEHKEKFTVEDFLKMPWDTWSLVASRTVPYLVEISRKIFVNESNPDLLKAVQILSEWDFRGRKESKAMSIFHWWALSYAERTKKYYAELDPMGLDIWRGIGDPETAIVCLREAVSYLRSKYGKFPISWGEIQRIRHGKLNLPIGGGGFGMLFPILGEPDDKDGKIYATGGHSYVSVVVFTNPPKAWSIFPYGHNRINVKSKHYTDQTKLFAKSQFKPAWFTKEEIIKNLEKVYNPGKE